MPDAAPTLIQLAQLRKRARTPEQQARYEEIQDRNRRMQVRGVPAPKSGTFGGKAKDKSK